MTSPESGEREPHWNRAEPDRPISEITAGSEAEASPEPAASNPGTAPDPGTGIAAPGPAPESTSAGDFFGGTPHPEPAGPGPQARPRQRPTSYDEPTTSMSAAEMADLQRRLAERRAHADTAESTGAHHLGSPQPGPQPSAQPPQPPPPPYAQPAVPASYQTGRQPIYQDPRMQGSTPPAAHPAPQPNYPPPHGGPVQPAWSAPQYLQGPQHVQGPQYAPAMPAGYAGGYEQQYAHDVNSVAASGGLTQAFRQERHTTVVKPQPQSGWRHGVLVSTFGLVNLGESKIEREDRERRARVNANVSPPFVFAVIAGKGGAAKTTTAASVCSEFAKCRGGGEVVVVDANPDEGNLASRVNPGARHTFVDLLSDPNIGSRSAIRKYAATSETSQLDVLASSDDLVHPPTFDPDSFTETIRTLSNVYNVIGIDCGSDFRTPLVQRVLDTVTAVVVVSGVQFDSGKSAIRMYDWLVATGRTELVQRSFLMLSEQTPDTQTKLRAAIEDTVSSIVWKDPIYVPYDPHLYEASVIDLAQLNKRTERAYLAAAAKLSDWYGASPVPVRQRFGDGR